MLTWENYQKKYSQPTELKQADVEKAGVKQQPVSAPRQSFFSKLLRVGDKIGDVSGNVGQTIGRTGLNLLLNAAGTARTTPQPEVDYEKKLPQGYNFKQPTRQLTPEEKKKILKEELTGSVARKQASAIAQLVTLPKTTSKTVLGSFIKGAAYNAPIGTTSYLLEEERPTLKGAATAGLVSGAIGGTLAGAGALTNRALTKIKSKPVSQLTPDEKSFLDSSITETRTKNTIVTDKPSKITSEAVADTSDITSTAEMKTSVGKVTKAAKDINKRLVQKGFDELPDEELARYSPIYKTDQINKVTNLIDNDETLAIKMASGEAIIPADTNSQVLFNAVEKKAQEVGDAETLLKLAKSPVAVARSKAAQELGASAWGKVENSPVKYIDDLNRAHIDANGGADKVAELKQKQFVQISDVVKKTTPTRQNWSEFIESIRC